jgi:hypothetical protein
MQSKGFSEKAITSALLEENERCTEPLTENQIIDKNKKIGNNKLAKYTVKSP